MLEILVVDVYMDFLLEWYGWDKFLVWGDDECSVQTVWTIGGDGG